MVLGPTARLWLPYLNFTVAISALGFQTAVLYPWHEELDKEFKILKQEHKEQLHLHQQVTLKQLQDLERRTTAAEKAMPGLYNFSMRRNQIVLLLFKYVMQCD
ncbi:hypothetical protein E4T50_07487 [Aureobasidium sp. EXF-12298]|nr:hypothetical protein E4T50_07487 [Aureobasidium sp. EXF-12298]KAI4759489.1 hypothetical protein E4T51_07477 [Aureobasidium sp. EXF-12344]KAI4776730.1 hypothetical protein E4T52_08357 [Aureobasidium sp. EXF-3400]